MSRQTSVIVKPSLARNIVYLKARGFGTFTRIIDIAVDRMARDEQRKEETEKENGK